MACSTAASAAQAAPPSPESAIAQSIDAARVAGGYGVITSIYRSPAHNRSVGGVFNSYHLAGRAIDVVRRPGVSHFQVAAVLRKAGYELVESIDEGDHSHFAFGLPRSAIREPAEVAAKTPPAEPQPPLLAADDHGKLLLDLAPHAELIAARGPEVRSGDSRSNSR